MKNSFTNLQTFPSEKALFLEEINAVILLMHEILDLFDEQPDRGTIILDGQRKGEDARCIMRMNLENGTYNDVFCGRDYFSDALAGESIDKILVWPGKSDYPSYGYKAQAKSFGEMETGIYAIDRYKALVLNTTFGRFVMSVQLAFEKKCMNSVDGVLITMHHESIAAMKGVAVALAKMCMKDQVMQRSVEKLTEGMTVTERRVKEEVENLLSFCSLPELAAWKEWHEAAMAKGNLGLFFE